MLRKVVIAVMVLAFPLCWLLGVDVTGSEQLRGGDRVTRSTLMVDGDGDRLRFHRKQSKQIAIPVDGLPKGIAGKTGIVPLLHPTSSDAWTVLEDELVNGHIVLRLKGGRSWLPENYGFQQFSRWPLRWHGVEHNGVVTEFDTPITVAYIVEDLTGVTCDDSCEFAFDGACTDTLFQPLLFPHAYADDDETGFNPCGEGTDCTDCGGVEQAGVIVECSNSCALARNGICDDDRGSRQCHAGTDCDDCGPYKTAYVDRYNSMAHLLLGDANLATYVMLASLLAAVGAALCCMLPRRGLQCSTACGKA